MSALARWRGFVRGGAGFPPQAAAPVTLYLYYQDENEQCALHRCVLQGTHWQETTARRPTRDGIAAPTTTLVYIPFAEAATGRRFVPQSEWNKAEADWRENSIWTLNPRQGALVVQGECPHRFTPGTPAQLVMQENTFLQQNSGARRVQSVAPKLFGSLAMRHFVLQAGR